MLDFLSLFFNVVRFNPEYMDRKEYDLYSSGRYRHKAANDEESWRRFRNLSVAARLKYIGVLFFVVAICTSLIGWTINLLFTDIVNLGLILLCAAGGMGLLFFGLGVLISKCLSQRTRVRDRMYFELCVRDIMFSCYPAILICLGIFLLVGVIMFFTYLMNNDLLSSLMCWLFGIAVFCLFVYLFMTKN